MNVTWRESSNDGYNARFIQPDDEIDYRMAAYGVGKIPEVVNRESYPLKGCRVLILCGTFRPEVSEVRESPA